MTCAPSVFSENDKPHGVGLRFDAEQGFLCLGLVCSNQTQNIALSLDEARDFKKNLCSALDEFESHALSLENAKLED